ncbi:hypothetical protein TNCV_573711 [Trichonephila clavipes]|nr:hypothetical protein TNCV_573711 [Trichonephila clavipes]
MIRWALKLAEFDVEWEHHPEVQNVMAGVLSRNPVESIVGENIDCAVIRNFVLSFREQLISEQRNDPELSHVANVGPTPFDYLGDQTRMVLLPEEVGEKGFLESRSPTFRILV